MRASIGCLLALLSLSVARADNISYYVDAQEGSDAADGRSEKSAWRTLNRVNKMKLGPGDKLLFRSGCRWVGQLKLQGSGAEGNAIHVGRYGEGQTPHVAGDGKTDVAVIIKNGSYWVIEDLEVTNTIPGGKRRNRMAGVKVVANSGGTFRQITLRRLHVHHVSGGWDRHGGWGILVTASGDQKDAGIRRSRYDGLLIEDCYVHDVSFYGIFVSGYENRFRDERWYPSSNVVIRNNFTHDTGGDSVVVVVCKEPLIAHNEAHRCAIGQSRGGTTAAAGIWPHSSDGTVMRYNKVVDIDAVRDGQGFDVDINCRNTLVEYNWSQRNRGGFLLLCSPSPDVPGTSGVIVRNNVSIDDGKDHGVITIASDVRNVTIHNNAILDGTEGTRPFFRAFTPRGSRKGKTDILFTDNIFSTAGTYFHRDTELVVPVFEGNSYAGGFQNWPEDATRVEAKYPAAKIQKGKVASTYKGSTFKPFDSSRAGLLPTSSWLRQRDLSASCVTKQDGEQGAEAAADKPLR